MKPLLIRVLAISVSIIHAVVPDLANASPIQSQPPLVIDMSVCQEESAILGTEGPDSIVGTPGDDIICSFGGNDSITGLDGNDLIISGDGADQVDAGPGADRVFGGSGDDSLIGGLGADSLMGDSGDDDLAGGEQDDYLYGGEGADNLWGNLGFDSLLAGAGNDGLDGGAGQDYLNGESGKNTCLKDLSDTTIKCFYDNQAPIVKSVAIDPATAQIDASRSEKVVRVRLFVSDPGAGVKRISLGFTPKADLIRQTTDGSYGDGGCYGTTLLAGSPNRGIYEISCTVPVRTLQTTYYLSYLWVEDQVGNTVDFSYDDLKRKKFAVSFKQTGVPDTTAPKLNSLEIQEIPTWTANGQEFTFVIDSDDFGGTGLSEVQLNYTASHSKWNGMIRLVVTPWDLSACNLETTISQCELESNRPRGRLLIKLGLSKEYFPDLGTFYGQGEMLLKSVKLIDRAGNFSVLKTRESLRDTSATITKMFNYPVPLNKTDGDTKAPEILSIQIDKTNIDTGSGSDSVRVTFRAKDQGMGFFERPGVPFLTQFRVQLFNFDFEQNIQYVTKRVVSISGTQNDITAVVELTFPPHFPRCKMELSVAVADASMKRNVTTWSSKMLQKKGLPSVLVNG